MNSFDRHLIVDGCHAVGRCGECSRIELLENIAEEAVRAVSEWIRPSMDGTHYRIPRLVAPLLHAVLALGPTSDIEIDRVQ